MWADFPDLHQRIVKILGEDARSSQVVAKIQIFPNQVLVEVYERYDEPPKNLKSKGKNCLRFELAFQPISVSVTENMTSEASDQPIKHVTNTSIEFDMGQFNYRFDSEAISFFAFQALDYAKVVDNNFGRMVD
jgi:hypothetical protein